MHIFKISLKIVGQEQMVGPKNLGSKTILYPKILFGKKMLGQRNFWVKEIIMDPKKLGSEKCLVPKISFRKNCGSTKFKFWVQTNFRPPKNLAAEKLGSKTFYIQTKILVPKDF